MNRKRWYQLINLPIGLWLVAAGVVVLVHPFVPAGGWLMVHLLLLGAVSTAILVWSQHFADSVLRSPSPGGRAWHGVRLLGHTVGALLVVAGIVSGWWPLVLAGAVFVGAVAVAHAVTLVLQGRGALPARFAPLVRFYVAAALMLVVGVAIGVLMARADLSAALHDRLYAMHLAFNLLGWVGLTVVGTFVLLWPTVLRARVPDAVGTTTARALVLMVAGLLVFAIVCLIGLRPGVAVALAVYLAGLALVLKDGVVQARASRPSTFAGWSIGAAMVWFAICVVWFGIALATAPDWADAGERLAPVVGPLAVGFAAQVLLGALSYLLPVVIGGGPEVSRRTARELDRGAVFRVVVVNGGIVLFLLPVPSLVKVVVSLVVFLTLVAFLPLAIRALLKARRRLDAKAPADRSPSAESASTPVRHGGPIMAAFMTLVLAVTGGVALDPAAAGLAIAQPQNAVVETGETTTVEIGMKNMRFTPDVIEVPVGDRLEIVLTNEDDQVHDLVLANGANSGRLYPGDSVTFDAGVIGGDVDGWCSVAGHRQMGMVLTVVAVGKGEAGEGATDEGAAGESEPGGGPAMGGHGHHDAPATGPSAAEDIDLMREPGDDFEARDAVLPPAASGTVHKRTFTVQEVEREVAPGVTQRLWTFGGTAPGPTLRGKVGDVFEITLVNDGTIGHSIDFHAGALAPDEPMRTIAPGESLTYRFTATRSGIWLYHCSTMPMSAHIANGMFGAVVIDPPGLTEADREFLLVQSEFYLGPQGGEVDLAKVATQLPDLVTFNGYANQYRYRPLTAKVGEKVRIWVLDAGPNVPSSFHIVGGQFDTVYFEGDYLLRDGGSTGTGGSQALALQPAQGGFVELTFPEPGNYPVVTHIMSDAEKGAAGTFKITQ